jgi:hypothetical protein
VGAFRNALGAAGPARDCARELLRLLQILRLAAQGAAREQMQIHDNLLFRWLVGWNPDD